MMNMNYVNRIAAGLAMFCIGVLTLAAVPVLAAKPGKSGAGQ